MEILGSGNYIVLTNMDHGFCKIIVNGSNPLWINKHRLTEAYSLIGDLIRQVKRPITYQEVHDLLSQHFLVLEED
ncbi:hypothetical protein Goe16_02040 [Bacillus phage vB_BsuM-Goe16]|nr:hypothetical protein Goe16_00100 [Bacillus phage vB_BsuM-Goe16]WCS68618.1 hypothetical protein Goe16_02040 [Bacillus phage vB_BsuM-Goe16]